MKTKINVCLFHKGVIQLKVEIGYFLTIIDLYNSCFLSSLHFMPHFGDKNVLKYEKYIVINMKFIIASLLLINSLLISSVIMASNNDKLIVNVDWLKQHIEDKNIVIVDTRSYNEYMEGHIPDSVNIPVSNTFNPKKNKDRVANSAHIQNLFSNVGINYEDTVLVYDSGNHIDAGRVFWVFEVFGHKNVKLLSGGFSAWIKDEDNKVSKNLPDIKKSNYIPRLEPQRLSTKLSMQLAIDDNNRIIIDSRTEDEYNGVKSIASRFGHIPNSINIPWNKNFTEEDGIKVLKSSSELKKVYDQLDSNKKVLLYCNKGKQSSLSYMVMRQLGFDAAHYDGSWYEWGNDDSLPIE